MWTRKELKERAKAVLKNIYWKAFLISMVILLVGGKDSGIGGGSSRSSGSTNNMAFDFTDPNVLYSIIFIIIAAIGVIMLAVTLRIFLGYPLEVGGRKYFVQSAQYKDNKKCFRFAFNGQNYFGIVFTMLLKGVQNFLWFLLLIIPGIIKLYAYRMVQTRT